MKQNAIGICVPLLGVLLAGRIERLAAADLPIDKRVRVGSVTLSWAEKDRNLAHVLTLIRQAVAERVQILCLPQECVPSNAETSAADVLQSLAHKDIFHLTFHEDRKLFEYLVDPRLTPTVRKGVKRKIRASIAQVFPEHGPNPQPQSVFARTLDQAGQRGSDVILMSEFGFPTNTPAAEKTFALVAGIAFPSTVAAGNCQSSKPTLAWSG